MSIVFHANIVLEKKSSKILKLKKLANIVKKIKSLKIGIVFPANIVEILLDLN